MQIQTDEARIILAMEAVRSSSKMSIRRAATLYEVPRSSLAHRLAGRTPRNETKANCHKLTKIEEVIVRYILDLDTRGFAPWLASVEDMANYILESWGGKRVGKLWAPRFIQRQLDLKTRFNRVYTSKGPCAKILS